MPELTQDQHAQIRDWKSEKTASGETRRPWADGSNAAITQFVERQFHETGALDRALEKADAEFAARPIINPRSERAAQGQYANPARQALIAEYRAKEGENARPGWNPSKAQVEDKARSMFIAAQRRYST